MKLSNSQIKSSNITTNSEMPTELEDLYIYDSKDKVRTMMVTLLDLEIEKQKAVFKETDRDIDDSFVTVFVTDNPDFSELRKQSKIFEYLPSLTQQSLHSESMPWKHYLRERWILLMTKWRPEKIIGYGLNIDKFIDAAPDGATISGDIPD